MKPNLSNSVLPRQKHFADEGDMSDEVQITYRACNLCEAICGLTIEHDHQHVLSIKGDREDPLSRGHLCPKALALQDIYTDPDRLRRPMRRTSSGFKPISWGDAFAIVGEKITAIRKEYGDDSVALYLGNPTVHNYGALFFQSFLKDALRTKNRFSATSVDQLPHHFVANQMFGHGLLIPVPDIDNSDYLYIIGANPAVSNGSMMTAPDVKNRMKSIRERGGKIVLLDPRATETSPMVDEHHFIRPGTDVYLLAATLNVIFSEGLPRVQTYRGALKNLHALQEAVRDVTPDLVAKATGVDAEVIRRLAIEFARARRAVIYGRIGVSTQEHGGICHWLINAINLVTGNLDRPGGPMFTKPAVNIVGRRGTSNELGRWHSRVRQLPEFEGELPVSVMAEEMLTPGSGQIRALITNAGNPVLSTPNGSQLDRAIEGLDFYVAIDIYRNETTRHADLILPPTTGLESDHYDLAFNALAVRNVAKYSPQIFETDGDALSDWQIIKELTKRLTPPPTRLLDSLARPLKMAILEWVTPQRLLNIGLATGPYGAWRRPFRGGLNLNRLKASVHGVDLGELRPRLPGVLRTIDKKIDAAPARCIRRFEEVIHDFATRTEEPSEGARRDFALIGRRSLRSNNSWMHNSQRLVKGKNRCSLMMHTSDAQQLQLVNGEDVNVRSAVGEISIPLEITDAIMPGVVSIPHGYGHARSNSRLQIANANAGVSINDLTNERIVDELTGNAAFSAQRVSVTRTLSGSPSSDSRTSPAEVPS